MDGPSALQSVLDRLTERRVPGMAAVVVEDGALTEVVCAGVRDLADGAPTTADTVHLWFSMTKIVTATAVMQLAERGALDLDDPVERFLPEFPKPRAGWPNVLVRHLLSHSSGLANPIPVRWVHLDGAPARASTAFATELLSRRRALRAPSGGAAAYSNVGYIALGEVIGAAAGKPYEDYVRENILEPLSLTRTGFGYDVVRDPDVATGHQLRRSPMTPLFRLLLPKGILGANHGRFVALNRFVVDGPAYGGLVGSARDAARFMAVHLGGGEFEGVRLLSPESVRAMQTIQASSKKFSAGFGWFRRGAEAQTQAHLEHLGGGGGFWNMMRIHPERGIGVLAMGNATSYDHERVAAAAEPPVPPETHESSAETASYG